MGLSAQKQTSDYNLKFLLTKASRNNPFSGASMTTNDLSTPSPANTRTLSVCPRHSIYHGITPAEALSKYESELTSFEFSEIGNHEIIYTVGSFRVNSYIDVCT